MAFSQLIDGELLEKSLAVPKMLEKASFFAFPFKDTSSYTFKNIISLTYIFKKINFNFITNAH